MNRNLLAAALTCTLALPANVLAAEPDPGKLKGAVVIVRPHYYDETRAFFKELSDGLRFASQNASSAEERAALGTLARLYLSHSESPQSGSGWLVRAGDNERTAYVITNGRLASQAPYVTLEWDRSLSSYPPIERCTVIYVDPTADIAVIAVPRDRLPGGVVGLELSGQPVHAGTPVWAAGFASALGNRLPMYQFSQGIVNNSELTMPGQGVVIQHGATIDPGNSGGPLLVQDSAAAIGYRVIGLNWFRMTGRTNVNLAIPAGAVNRALKQARDARQVASNKALLKAALERRARWLAQELGRGEPDARALYELISDRFVAERGIKVFQGLFASLGTMRPEEQRSFLQDPVENVRWELFRTFLRQVYSTRGIGGVKFERIYESDLDRYETRGVRSLFVISEQKLEVTWTFEHGTWKIADLPLWAPPSQPTPRQAPPT